MPPIELSQRVHTALVTMLELIGTPDYTTREGVQACGVKDILQDAILRLEITNAVWIDRGWDGLGLDKGAIVDRMVRCIRDQNKATRFIADGLPPDIDQDRPPF